MEKLRKPRPDDYYLLDGIDDLSRSLVGYTEISVVIVAPVMARPEGPEIYIMQVIISPDPRNVSDDEIIHYKALPTYDYEKAVALARDIFSDMTKYYDENDLSRYLKFEGFELSEV